MSIDLFMVSGVAAAITAIIVLITTIKKSITGTIQRDLDEIRAELRPNSGSSLRDAIDLVVERQSTIGREIRDLKGEVQQLRTKTDDHIQWHLNQKG